MPFARRRDVQVLEDDRSEYLLQRTATIWTLFGQNKLKNKAAKPVQNHRAPEKEKKWALLVFRDLLQCLDGFLGRLCRFDIAPVPERTAPKSRSSGAASNAFARANVLKQRVLLPRKLLQLHEQLSSSWVKNRQQPRRPTPPQRCRKRRNAAPARTN